MAQAYRAGGAMRGGRWIRDEGRQLATRSSPTIQKIRYQIPASAAAELLPRATLPARWLPIYWPRTRLEMGP